MANVAKVAARKVNHISKMQPISLQFGGSNKPSIARGLARFLGALEQLEDATGGIHVATTRQLKSMCDLTDNLSCTLAKMQGQFRDKA